MWVHLFILLSIPLISRNVISPSACNLHPPLTHWGQVTHICASKLAIIGSDNGLPPGRRQAIVWTNAGILLIGPLGANFSEILIAISIFSFKKMDFKMSSGKWRPFCLGLKSSGIVIILVCPSCCLCGYSSYPCGLGISASLLMKIIKIRGYIGQVMKLRLSSYLVLLSIDCKTR